MTIPNFTAGQWTRSAGSAALPVADPATGDVLAQVPLSTGEDVGRAVAAAARAFPAWRDVPAPERAQVLFRLRHLLEQNLDRLAESMTREHGKTREESLGELRRGIESVSQACAAPVLLLGDALEQIAPGIDCETVRQPLGVFAVITPYNFPVMIPLWFWPFAVVSGNTVVLKPSERDPLTHQLVVELAVQAGLPPGVLNVVHGDQAAVGALLEHPEVTGVSFVGGSATARSIYAAAAAAGKRVQALGGAKNHLIVLPDADLAAASRAAVASAYGAAGQRCLAGSIVVGVGEAYEAVREQVREGAAALRLGHGLDPAATMGPLISAAHRDRVAGYVERGEREGARLLLDGRGAQVDGLPAGHWFGPTLFEDVTPAMAVGREEIFGPVAGLARAESLAEALDLVHRNAFGNAVSLFTRSGAAAREFRYRAGISMIGINIGVVAPMPCFPFGGSRGSFYGDLKAQGRDAVAFFTDQRVVISRW